MTSPTVRWGDAGRVAAIPAWLVVSPVSANAVRLYALLSLHVGDATPTRQQLAAALHVSVDATDRALLELTACGAVTRDNRNYTLHAVAAVAAEPVPAQLPVVQTTTLDAPPSIPRIEGRNLPLDALNHACNIDDDSPRVQQAVVALNGRRGVNGITHLFWEQCRRTADGRPDGTNALTLLHDDPERYSRLLAQEIAKKVELIHRNQPWRETLTPDAIRDLWLDIHLIPEPKRRDRGLTPEEVRQLR